MSAGDAGLYTSLTRKESFESFILIHFFQFTLLCMTSMHVWADIQWFIFSLSLMHGILQVCLISGGKQKHFSTFSFSVIVPVLLLSSFVCFSLFSASFHESWRLIIGCGRCFLVPNWSRCLSFFTPLGHRLTLCLIWGLCYPPPCQPSLWKSQCPWHHSLHGER